LVNESWVLPPPGSVIASVVEEAFRAKGLSYPRTTVITESSEARTSLLATGRYLAVYPTSALRFSATRPEIKTLPVKLPMAKLPNGIATLKNRALSPVAQLFIDRAREVAKPLANRK
jgi:DNA-binding transcriptional LysR family regulator